ncbi:hypothetical protein pSalSNUABM01_025 [Salmonella phage pSal-SNUABM-01]|nr:hypothetical protein pSalSNUABM01_025 [Salmonella phage pSal-SNUABM-01]
MAAIDRTKQPYRIYKPLFMDEKQMKMDLDREFESISQALIWVTNNMVIIVDALNTLLPAGQKIELVYPKTGN